MNTDTPETDAEHAQFAMGGFTLDFCRKLERERDEAREALENHMAATIHTCHDECKRPMCVLRRERDEAREALLIIANSEPKNIGSILAQGFFDYHNLKKQEIDERRKKEAEKQNT